MSRRSSSTRVARDGETSRRTTQGLKSRKTDSTAGRIVLFPTEPSKLGRQKIEQAIDRVISKK